MEVSQSLQQNIHDQYEKLIKENSPNKQEIANFIVQILENLSLYTFSEFLQLPEIDGVIEKLLIN
jgi:hypothetical protein